MANRDIRLYMRGRGVTFWRLADELGIHENTLYYRLRHELPEIEKGRLRALVDGIAAEEAEA